MSGNHLRVCSTLTRAIAGARTVEEIYQQALEALAEGVDVARASILLFEPDGVMRFKAWRGLSEPYRRAVEGHCPWTPNDHDPDPIIVSDVETDPAMVPFLPVLRAERIGAMAFIPLVSSGTLLGKFMLYHHEPRAIAGDELTLAQLVASQVAFAVARLRAEQGARRGASRLRFALDAASMGTWDWDASTGQVTWSENFEALHGLPAASLTDSFSSYARAIHPEDRGRVLQSVQRAMTDGTSHDIEYRTIDADGDIRWVVGKGTAELRHGAAVHMTGVCVIVTRRKEAEIARLSSAEEASRLKDEFLAVLSHELRTPLNAILGWVQMLQAGSLPPERLAHAIEVIGRNATLQAQLIEDILDVSRIITGKLDVQRERLDVARLLEIVVAGAQPSATAKGVTLEMQVHGDVPAVEGDARRLQQVLSNILSNAIRFTPEGGRVHLGAGATDGRLRIEVRDTGVGIDRDFLPHVFDRFRQADSRSTRRYGGLGLGLAIAQHLVEQHHGSIRAESEGPGTGTTIVLELPTAPPAPMVAPRPAAAPPAPELRMDGSRVVVVDDQRDSRELVAQLCEQRGADVVRCDAADSALDVITGESADLIVADIAMPDTDGCELIRRVRERHLDVPAIAVSAYARPEDRTRALASGFNAYCQKPLDTGQFLETVREVMHR